MGYGNWDRRGFLIRCAGAAMGLCAVRGIPGAGFPALSHAQDAAGTNPPDGAGGVALSTHRASHWKPAGDRNVICTLCPRECHVPDGDRGFCDVRFNDAGTYRSLIYGRVCSAHVDPVEKKPLFHVLPGTTAFSISSSGCNLECLFCQNWEISQVAPEKLRMIEARPEQITIAAKDKNCPLIAHTYTEPLVGWEWVRDVAEASADHGIRNVIISAGYIQEKPFREILPHLAAVKIDLKGFTDEYYREVVNGERFVIQRTLEILKETGTWFEIVNLVVPTLNDDERSTRAMCEWVAGALGEEVPIHFTRFHPQYKLQSLPSTPVKTLERIHGYAREAGLKFAYIGNVPGHPAEHTYCPECGQILIQRTAYTILRNELEEGRCSSCGREIPGIWS